MEGDRGTACFLLFSWYDTQFLGVPLFRFAKRWGSRIPKFEHSRMASIRLTVHHDQDLLIRIKIDRQVDFHDVGLLPGIHLPFLQ